MDLFHNTDCPCAYCDLERDERTASRKRLARAGALLAVLLLATGWWFAL